MINDKEIKLIKDIEHHNTLYWDNATPEISDQEYDLLLVELEKINPNHPLITKINTPLVETRGKVKHKTPMLSLSKAYTLEELLIWAKKFARNDDEKFKIEPKYDGISANYENATLATRGNGEVGENISDKIPLIELESKDYQGKLDRESRGEIVIRNDDFKNLYSNIVRKDGKSYKNSRNAVAGIMGLKDINHLIEQKAKLTFVDYTLISYSTTLANFANDWNTILEKIEDLPYPMDGIVVKFSDNEYALSLGSTAHHPRSQIAFKFSGIRKTTKLLDVNWSFGKNCLTPVALLEPVDIAGITIKHATLHNIQNIIDRDIHIGDTVTIERAGDVIPYISDSKPGEDRKSCLITECPSCNSILLRKGPEIYCNNDQCKETLLQRLLASVKNIGIERLGEPNIRKMQSTLNVNSLKDIFQLSLSDILKLEGFKAKSANNLINEIRTAKNVTDFQLLASLNVHSIGKNIAKKILTNYTIEELRTLTIEDISNIDGVGPERTNALFCELRNQSNYLDEMIESLSILTTKGDTSSKLPTICFTGKMEEKRSFYEKIAKEHNFEPTSSVNKDLSILVTNDINSTSSKVQKAKKLGLELIEIENWLSTLKNDKEKNINENDSNLINKNSQAITSSNSKIDKKIIDNKDSQQLEFGF